MLVLMQRDQYKAVTVPILIPCPPAESEGTATFLAGFGGLQPLRPLRDEDLDKNTVVGIENWKQLSDNERKRLCGVVTLIQALRSNDSLAAEKASQQLQHLETGLFDALSAEKFKQIIATMQLTVGPSAHSFARLLSRTVSEGVRKVALVLWRRGTEILPALFCPTISSAIYIRALLKSSNGEAIRICPKCGEPFLQKQSNQDYCSVRCREAHRVARWRANKLDKGPSLARKKPVRKSRAAKVRR
jgi:hypothetical protein